MEKRNELGDRLFKLLTYLLVAAVASCLTYYMYAGGTGQSKLDQLESLIMEYFIGEADPTAMEDAAAAAMVKATGDRWSYYIPASQYDAHVEQMQNAYVGIGVSISSKAGDKGFEILQIEPAGGADEAGLQAGDILLTIEGKSVLEIGIDAARNLIRGEEDTQISVSVLRAEETLSFSVTRKMVQVVVARGQMLEDNIGLVTITNFDERCADETLSVIETLLDQGAQSLIFDVRFNPGGYKRELVRVLDYLLPEGILFRSLTYAGEEEVTQSDADCLKLPMAVLINESSYSAAEFFAAALSEYDWAVLVGEPTTGKSYFQNTIVLKDGSAVGLSVGKYFTPNGVSLAEAGGLKPEIKVEVDKDTKNKIYAGAMDPSEDPQIQAAVAALKTGA